MKIKDFDEIVIEYKNIDLTVSYEVYDSNVFYITGISIADIDCKQILSKTCKEYINHVIEKRIENLDHDAKIERQISRVLDK